jgi:uncharacterized Zn finger protein
VAERQARAAKEAAKLSGKGHALQPVRLAARQIAATFWGKAWCENLEAYSDFANRLPRGRSYVRNGSVLHLDIRKGEIEALVSGSSLYKIKIGIKPVAPAKWASLCRQCAGSIGSLMELLAGRLSERVMDVMTKPDSGLFPTPAEIVLGCSCPDWADMCKHVAAVLYGVGARLDEKPELLFALRHVDHNELVSQASTAMALTDGTGTAEAAILDAADVSEVFGIELDAGTPSVAAAPTKPSPTPKSKRTSTPIKPKASVPGKPARQGRKQVILKKPVKRKRTVQKRTKRAKHVGQPKHGG